MRRSSRLNVRWHVSPEHSAQNSCLEMRYGQFLGPGLHRTAPECRLTHNIKILEMGRRKCLGHPEPLKLYWVAQLTGSTQLSFIFLMAQKLGPLLVLEWNRSVSSSSVLQFDLRLATPSKWLRELATFQAHLNMNDIVAAFCFLSRCIGPAHMI